MCLFLMDVLIDSYFCSDAYAYAYAYAYAKRNCNFNNIHLKHLKP